MTIYPAIDLIDGRVVRLKQGDYARKTEYSDDPAAMAKQFEADGAQYIHIVDLDGAKAKQPVNTAAIQAIGSAVKLPLQVGGGIRSLESAKKILQYVDRVIIGTLAITEPQVLTAMIEEFGGEKIVVSIDYKGGRPAINGWLEVADGDRSDLPHNLARAGVKTVIITDVSRDGLLAGPNIELMKQWKAASFEVIAAGGVSSSQDIADLRAAGIDGAIIGKALYEGKISLKELRYAR